ncbi:MAG: nucleotidyltransferase family protein [Candidatus Sumerlaeota bacterium]|nr:nucleotidyltransferase family protein [Candidatus Sumerlaeota bacterium]
MSVQVGLAREAIERFCQKWRITELSLFGSVLRDDFGPQSDVDALVDFAEDAEWSLLDLVQMKLDLEEIFGRRVDLLTRRAVERSRNWIRRRAILESAERIYGQG